MTCDAPSWSRRAASGWGRIAIWIARLARSVRQGSVEVDRGVGAIAERLVRRVSAAAHRHRVGMFDHMPVRRRQGYWSGDDVGAVFAGGEVYFGHQVSLLGDLDCVVDWELTDSCA